MSDIPSTWPDNWYIEQNIKPTSHYEKILWKEYPVESKEIWGVIIDTKKWVITIVQKAETKKETNKLNNNFKIESVFKNLEEKNPDFDRENFKIEKAPLLQEEIDYLWYELFIISNKKGVELYFVDNEWETIIDLTKLKTDDFKHLLVKKASKNYFIRSENWRLSFYINEFKKSFPVKSRYFTNAIMKYENIQPKKD